MNFLTFIFKVLFSADSFAKGTLNAAKKNFQRKTVNADVKNHYDHDKDFFISFLKRYVFEAYNKNRGVSGT